MPEDMTLAEYMNKRELTQVQVGEAIGVPQSMVSRWLSGEKRPNLNHAIAIERWTRGKVPATSWLGGQP